MNYGRSEPAGLHELRKQVTETKEGPLELKKKKGKENTLGGRREGKVWVCSRESAQGKEWDGKRCRLSLEREQVCHNSASGNYFETFKCIIPLSYPLLFNSLDSGFCFHCQQSPLPPGIVVRDYIRLYVLRI